MKIHLQTVPIYIFFGVKSFSKEFNFVGKLKKNTRLQSNYIDSFIKK